MGGIDEKLNSKLAFLENSPYGEGLDKASIKLDLKSFLVIRRREEIIHKVSQRIKKKLSY